MNAIMHLEPIHKLLLIFCFAIVVQEQAAVIAKLNTKLKSVVRNLEDANKREILYLTLILVL